MKRFVLETYKNDDGTFEYNGWWEYEDGYLYNRVGGRHKANPNDEMWKYSKVVEANDWTDLDWSYLIDNSLLLGWISPDGRFYGCKYEDHAKVAELYFKKSEKQLEKEGWVKVYYSSVTRSNIWYSEGLIVTEAQRIQLEKLGLEVDVDVCELIPPTPGAVNGSV